MNMFISTSRNSNALSPLQIEAVLGFIDTDGGVSTVIVTLAMVQPLMSVIVI